MRIKQLRQADLNLLVVFTVLAEERNASRAATRLFDSHGASRRYARAVYEVYSDNAAGPFDGDILYLRCKADLAMLAKMYWSGMRTNTPMLEWLIRAPLTIGPQVGTI